MIAYNPARHKASAPQTRPTANLPFCPASAASSSGIADRNGPRSSSNAIWLAAAAPEAANSSHKSSAAAATRPPPVPNAWSNASRIQSPERRCITCRQTVSTQASTLPPSTQSQPLLGSAIAAGTLSAHRLHARICRGVSLSRKNNPSVFSRQQNRRAERFAAQERGVRIRQRHAAGVRLQKIHAAFCVQRVHPR